jgi:hypothetical protein
MDPTLSGTCYSNCGVSHAQYPINIGRMRNAVLLAAARSGWGSLSAVEAE